MLHILVALSHTCEILMMQESNSITMERKRLLNRNNSADGMSRDDSDAELGAPPSRNGSRDARHSSHGSLITLVKSFFHSQQSIKLLVLIVLSLQNSLFTVLRRYSQGIKKEQYSKYEVLMMGEIIKLLFSAYMIRRSIVEAPSRNAETDVDSVPLVGDHHHSPPPSSRSLMSLDQLLLNRVTYLIRHSGKMLGLAIIYGIMNILSFVALRNIGAGMFTIFAQCKILTTAAFSALILQRQYSWTQWRALISLVFGVLLFSEPVWNQSNTLIAVASENAMVAVGIAAVLIEVTLSGFASIYFEKVIKLDPLPLTIWERNFQLALVRFLCAPVIGFTLINKWSYTFSFFVELPLYICVNIGKCSGICLLYNLGRGWYRRLVWRLVALGVDRHFSGGGRWFAGRPLYQVWRCHFEDSGDYGGHHLIIGARQMVPQWSAHRHYDDCRCASDFVHLQLYL